jgi:hypothetical protein
MLYRSVYHFKQLSQADKLVTFVYKLNGDDVSVAKSHYAK